MVLETNGKFVDGVLKASNFLTLPVECKCRIYV